MTGYDQYGCWTEGCPWTGDIADYQTHVMANHRPPMYPPGLGGRGHGLADDTKRLVVAGTPLLVRVLNRLQRWLG